MKQDNEVELEDIDLDVVGEFGPTTRDLVLAFLRMPIEGKFTFTCHAGCGDKVIQRMRIRLAKLRTLAKARKRVIKPFKMVKVEVKQDEANPKLELVTLLKTMHQHQVAVSKNLEEALEAISEEGVTLNG